MKPQVISCLITLGIATLALAPSLNARNDETPVLDKYFTQATEIPAATDADGFIQRWTILEPIAIEAPSNRIFNDNYLKNAVYQNEYFKDQLTILPYDGMKTKVGKEKHIWHSLDSKNYFVNLLRFAEGYGKDYYGQVYWVVTTVNCEEDIENVRLSSGVNSAAMWWINGEEVLMLSNDRDLIVDDHMSKRLTLKKGENVIRGAVFNGPGMADFCLRFVDEDGNPVKNITVTVKQK